MKFYKLTKDAEQDLRDIARYTLKNWSKSLFDEYLEGLESRLNELPNKGRVFSNSYPKLLVAKYQYHHIFYLLDDQSNSLIIGVIHEKRDLVARLSERLQKSGLDKP